MPQLTPADQVGLHISTLNKAGIASFPSPAGRHPFPLAGLIRQVVSDRLAFAGSFLRSGDQFVAATDFRSAISRHYYAMYHAARAIVFAEEKGDDYERHNVLPRHLPANMNNAQAWENELTNARLLRNQADYDLYPVKLSEWETDSRNLRVVAASFVNECEMFALANGHV